MKEIDFDELDKAVNTLMADVEAEAVVATAGASDLAAQSSDISYEAHTDAAEEIVSPPTEESPVNMTLITPAPAETGQASATTLVPPLAARRGGRFMDVVHPSSDMKVASNIARPSREGVSLAPVSPPVSVGEDIARPQDEGANSSPPQEYAATYTGFTYDESATTMPDPLDMMQDFDASDETTQEPESNDDIPLLEDDVALMPPLTSPFLADAKVEKRPLGSPFTQEPAVTNEAIGEDESSNTLLSADVQETTNESSNLSDATAASDGESQVTSRQTPLPAELHSDLLAIESGTEVEMARTEQSVIPEATPVVPEAVSTPHENEVSPSVPPAIGSIPQQYQEKPSTEDVSHVPIYDTQEAAAPLEHPAKKKSGWLAVIWILALVIISIAAAAALYYFNLV